jgi:hypothetical protein
MIQFTDITKPQRPLGFDVFLSWNASDSIRVRPVKAALGGAASIGSPTVKGETTLAPDRTRLTPAECCERGTAKRAAAMLGLKPRKLQAMSQRGEIPGAAKLGRQWSYDLAKLRRFVEQQEQATTCQNAKLRPGATGVGKFYGAKLRLKGSASGGRLRQMIQQSQKRAAKLAKRER